MKINPDNHYDYVYEAALFNQRESYTQMNDIFNIMMEQASFILEAAFLTSVKEDAAVGAAKGVKKAGQKVVSGMKKFIEFIKNMFNRFIEFVKTLFQNNEKWLNERKDEFSKMNYTGLSVTLVPYWEGKPITTMKTIALEASKIVDNYSLLDSAKTLSEDELKKALELTDPEKFLSKYATGGDHVDGIKNLMRVNNKDGKDAVELADNTLKDKIQNVFIPAVNNYKKTTDDVKKEFNDVESMMTKIDGAISKRTSETATESFMLLNESLSTSDVSLFYPVIEAEINSGDENKSSENKDDNKGNTKDSTQGNTKVEVKKSSESDREGDAAVAGMSTNTLKLSRNYAKCANIILGAGLTVLEERMSVYINVLKAVYKEANTRHGRKGNTEGQEEKK